MIIEKDILVVVDEIPNLQFLAEMLENEGYPVRPAQKAQTALDAALAKPPGLILLGVRMPGMDGLELCRRLKQDERTRHVPVIFISGLQDADTRAQAFEAGGVDFITKPVKEAEVLARVRTHIKIKRMQQQLEQSVADRTSDLNANMEMLEAHIRAFEESEERFELALAGSAAGIWDWSIVPNKVFFSDRFKQLLGYPAGEPWGTPDDFWTRLHPDDHDLVQLALDQHIEARVPYEIDYRLQTKSGEYRWYHARGQALWDDSGKAIRMSGSIVDINDRKKAEQERRRSEERFRNLMEQSPLGIIIYTPDGRIAQVNSAWMRLWGVDELQTERLKAEYNILTDPQLKELGVMPLVERAFAGEKVVWPPIEYRGKRTVEDMGLSDMEPNTVWFQSHCYPITDDHGAISFVVIIIMDITDLKQAEREVISSQKRFQELVEQSPMPLEILSPDGKIIETNSAWRKLWDVDEAGAEETISKYDMLNDPQLKKLGVQPLVEKAFSGEHIILPPIIYDAEETIADFGLENVVGVKSPWIQSHLYPIKDRDGRVTNVINTYVDITDQKIVEDELRSAFEEIKTLKEQLEAESAYLQDEIQLEHNFKNIVGQSEMLTYVLNRVEQVAPTDSPVLIMGETGTGKELMARALHEISSRGKRALVKVNCAALPRELIEAELFGREKGAYTGATSSLVGRFELAAGSTLFLDEIGELPLELQAKLLRVLESGAFERLGSTRTLRSDARIIAATNRVLEEEVRKGRFREDLWYRLKVFPITVPPLRERAEDIPLLVNWFVDQLSRKMGKQVAMPPKRTMEMLQRYPWPGNVRELKHTVESALITARGKKLNFELPQMEDFSISGFKPFEEMERDYILRVLKARNWKIGGKNSAAQTLGMHVNTLRGRMKKLGINKPKLR